jgi:hypothetical protein
VASRRQGKNKEGPRVTLPSEPGAPLRILTSEDGRDSHRALATAKPESRGLLTRLIAIPALSHWRTIAMDLENMEDNPCVAHRPYCA